MGTGDHTGGWGWSRGPRGDMAQCRGPGSRGAGARGCSDLRPPSASCSPRPRWTLTGMAWGLAGQQPYLRWQNSKVKFYQAHTQVILVSSQHRWRSDARGVICVTARKQLPGSGDPGAAWEVSPGARSRSLPGGDWTNGAAGANQSQRWGCSRRTERGKLRRQTEGIKG